jgi:molybdopterin/thiamine biosynthesis adenylyltransferase
MCQASCGEVWARRLIKSIAPQAQVSLVHAQVQSAVALDRLKGTDVLFGCVDNDGARLILNELALAYGIPYWDLAVGIDAGHGRVSSAGGRVAAVLPGGPCLQCMGEIDPPEATFFLGSPEEQRIQLERGYVRGLNVRAPAVVSLNAAIAAIAVNEFAVYVSGLRPVQPYSELDLLGVGRATKGQWLTPRQVDRRSGCVQCTLAGIGDAASVNRYATGR